MDDCQKWKNFFDFDEPSGPAHLVPSAPSSLQSQATSPPVNRVPDRQAEESGRQVRPDPDSPLVEQTTAVTNRSRQDKVDTDSRRGRQGAAAPRRGWLGGCLNYLTSQTVCLGIVFLCLTWYFLPVSRRVAQRPLYKLFDLDPWDEMQRNMEPLCSITKSKRFSDSEQIQATVEQAQISMHRCRFLVEDISTDLGTVVMPGVREWVFDDECTSTLPVVVRRSHGKIQRALDCATNLSSTLTSVMREVQETQSSDHETSTRIMARYSSRLGRPSSEQIAIDDERLDAVQQSLSNLTSIQSYLAVVSKGHQLERERLARLEEDMSSIDYLVHHSQEGAIVPQGSPEEEEKKKQTSVWDCGDFDIAVLRDSFFSLAVTVIGDKEKIGHFQSRYYYSTSP